MQHIRHTRQALSRLFSPERCRLSIAPAPGWRALGPGKAAAPGQGSSGEAAAPGQGTPPARQPRPRRVWTDEFSTTENSSHRATSYPRCPPARAAAVPPPRHRRRPLPATPGPGSSGCSQLCKILAGPRSQRRAEQPGKLPAAKGRAAAPPRHVGKRRCRARRGSRSPKPGAIGDAGTGSSCRAGHCPLAGSWLVFFLVLFSS